MSHPCVFPDILNHPINPFEWADKAPADDSWLKAEKGTGYESVMADPAKMVAAGRAVAAGTELPASIPQPDAIAPESARAVTASAEAKARDQMFDRIAGRVAAELQALGWNVEVRGADADEPDMVTGLLPDDDENDMSVTIGEAYSTLRVTGRALADYQVTLAYAAQASRFFGFMAPWGGMMTDTPSGFLADAEHPSVRLLGTSEAGQLSGGATMLWDETSRGGIPANELRKREGAIVRAIVSRLVELDELNAEHQARAE